jgi:hypothetical protein
MYRAQNAIVLLHVMYVKASGVNTIGLKRVN